VPGSPGVVRNRHAGHSCRGKLAAAQDFGDFAVLTGCKGTCGQTALQLGDEGTWPKIQEIEQLFTASMIQSAMNTLCTVQH
jgi:hypothetical protein